MRTPIANLRGESRDASGNVSLQLSGPLASGFVLARPVTVELFLENGEYVANVDDLHLHAFGATRDQALRNLRERIVAQHRKLQAHGGRLGPDMNEVAERLAALVIAEHA